MHQSYVIGFTASPSVPHNRNMQCCRILLCCFVCILLCRCVLSVHLCLGVIQIRPVLISYSIWICDTSSNMTPTL